MPAKTAPIDINVLRRLIVMCGLVEMIASEHHVHCREAASNVICRHFTGRGSWGGRVNKKLATRKMCAVYGWGHRGRGRRTRSLGLCRGGLVSQRPQRRTAIRVEIKGRRLHPSDPFASYRGIVGSRPFADSRIEPPHSGVRAGDLQPCETAPGRCSDNPNR